MEDTIRAFIESKLSEKAAILGVEKPEMRDDFLLTGTGLLDSMDFFGLITDIEEQYGIELDFTEKDPMEFSTLGGFLACAVETLQRR